MLTTTIAQGKKLLELGLESNTADMTILHEEPYETSDSKFDGVHEILCVPFKKYDKSFRQKYRNISYFPAWSLSALMDLLPSQFDIPSKFGKVFTYYINIRKYKLTDGVDLHQITYGNYGGSGFIWSDMINTGEYETLFEAAYAMLVWLLENKIINN